ncbi:MAG: efflux RND transporter periplasmic adaptor subunit [Syntrophomonadaceae bacterium]
MKGLESEVQANPEEKSRPVKKIFIISGAVLLVLVLIIVNIYRVTQKDVVKVDMAKVTQTQLVEKVPASGKIVAADKEVLFSEASGMVKAVHVRLGEAVKAGQVLIELSVPNAQEKLAQARADLARSEADLARARSGGKSSEVVAAEAALAQARSDYRSDEDAFKRAAVLYEQGAMSRVDYDKAQFDFENSQASLEKAESDLRRAQDEAPAKLRSYEAALESARLHLESMERLIEGQGLICPRDGQVLSISVSPGDMVNELSPILSISSMDKLLIEGSVPEAEASKIKPGQKVQISGNAFSDVKYQGRVKEVGLEVLEPEKAQADSSNSLPIIVEIENPGSLLPGYTIDMDITTAEENTLIVPVEALVEKDEGRSVWLVKNGTAQLVPVTTGISDGLTIQIKSGLELDNQVVLNPPADLSDGKKVRKK